MKTRECSASTLDYLLIELVRYYRSRPDGPALEVRPALGLGATDRSSRPDGARPRVARSRRDVGSAMRWGELESPRRDLVAWRSGRRALRPWLGLAFVARLDLAPLTLSLSLFRLARRTLSSRSVCALALRLRSVACVGVRLRRRSWS